jgi:demethylmenaquinone methyltransferase/2-methoxy-6-polyprenyl-1,4-benzoquinol methylase
MFARISGRYDLLNRVLSLGIDRSWRKRTVAEAGELEGRLVVDACCGTGDLSVAFARRGARVIGVDFTPQMLAHAGAKLSSRDPAVLFANGDALRLPLRSGCADVTSVAFGVRNLADARAGLAELARITKPGGRVLVLEFTTPRETKTSNATPQPPQPKRIFSDSVGTARGLRSCWRRLLGG